MLQICLQILPFTLLDFLKGLRHVDIERRQQSRFGLDAKLLQFRFIQIEILLTQWTHTHQFHLPLHHVDKHRQLVKPGPAQETSPLGDTVVIVELATHIKVVVLVDVCLKILRIGVHRPELKHVELLPTLPDAAQPNQWAIRMLVLAGLTFLLHNDTITVVDVLLTDHVETAIIKPAQHLGTREYFTHLFGTEIIKTTRQSQFRTHPMPQKIKEIDDICKELWIAAKNLCTAFLRCIKAANEIAVLLQFGVGTA